MKIMLKSRKGVSPVIASLLLIAISVAAAVITYSWVMAMIDTQGSAAQTAIRIEDLQFYTTKLTITVRNTGAVPVTITTIYIFKGETRESKNDDLTHSILAGAVLDMDVSGTFTISTAYRIKVVSDNGFVVEGTYYTPSTLAAPTP